MKTIQQVCRLIQPDAYMAPIDLQDAFLHVLIHSSSRQYLQFRWNDQTLRFKSLVFGLSLSPLIFTKILRPVLRWALRKGTLISAYLDDLIIIGKTKELTASHTTQVLNKLDELGFIYNATKSHLTPTQQLEHLGFHIDTTTMCLSVPKTKVRDLRREALRLQRTPTCSLHQLPSFIEKAQATTTAVFPARLHTRKLLQLKNQALAQGLQWTSTVSLTTALPDLQWWIHHLNKWNGLSFIPETPTQEVFTDASDLGWGIIYDSQTLQGTWTNDDLHQHINYRELPVIWKLIQLPQLQGQVLRVYCDNIWAIAYVKNFGGTRSAALMDLAAKIWNLCLKTKMFRYKINS